MSTEWRFRPLREVAHVEMGQSPPSEHVSEKSQLGLAFLQGNAEFSDLHPHARLRCSKPLKKAKSGDALISVRAPVGAINRANQDYCIGRGLAAIRFIYANPDYGYHALAFVASNLRKAAQGTTFEAVGIKDLRGLEFPDSPPPEQRRIAEILDTLDEAIRKTEQVIAKLQQMKQGLLHDLLTRGIDENGELRDPERHPEQFKDSPLGRIPRGWGVEAVEDLLDDVEAAMRSGPFGSALLKEELVDSGVPMLGIDNVYVERFERQFTRFVSPQKAVELSRYRVRPKDVMITIMGTVGRCALVPDDIGEALSSKHVWALTFNSARYLPYLACLQFNHAPWVLTHFGQDVQGGIMSAIRSETLRTALLPVPPIDEQIEIMSIFVDLDQRLTSESLAAGKLRTLKQGLMDDLLTGRVRVNLEEVE
jgi:type I restriction enzyme S subunit